MNVYDELQEVAQPGYEQSVAVLLRRLRANLGDAPFVNIGVEDFFDHAVAVLETGQVSADQAPQATADLSSISWWCGLPISDSCAGRMSSLTRAAYYEQAKVVTNRPPFADPAARRSHTVFVGALVGRLHSPTIGAFDYVRALVLDPDCEQINVYYDGIMTPDLEAYSAERLGARASRVRFIALKSAPDYIVTIAQGAPQTFHFWCDQPVAPHISLLAIFGPTIMFTCGDVAPVQFADVYWYCQDPTYMAGLWRRRGAPANFVANYCALESAPFNRLSAKARRTRSDLGFGLDEVVLVSVGNRIGVELDQDFVDGMGRLVLSNPKVRWVIAGPLPEFWISAFQSVLGGQFTHIPFEQDLSSLFELTDIFANPFRPGGGNSALLAIDAGTLVLTRDDMGDVRAFVPPTHRPNGVTDYFETLRQLIANPALRATRLAEQQALLNCRADLDNFSAELKALVTLAYERFAHRQPASLEDIYAQPPVERRKFKADKGRRVRLR